MVNCRDQIRERDTAAKAAVPKRELCSIEVWRCLACGKETYTGMEICNDCRCIALIMEWIHYRRERTRIEPERRGFYQQSNGVQ